MKKLFLPLFFLVACFGRRTEMPDNVIDLLATPGTELTKISQISTDVDYVPLQTTGKSFIKYVYDLKAVKNRYYINTQTEILCFDNTGKYLYGLDNTGRGPEEYLYIGDFDLNKNGDYMIFLASGKFMIYKNSVNGFSFSKSFQIKNQPAKVDFIPDQNNVLVSFYCEGNEPLRNLVINLDGDTLCSVDNHYMYTKKSDLIFVSNSENISFINKNFLCFKYWLSDTVFSIDNSCSVSPYLILKSHGRQITTEALADFSIETFSKNIIVNRIFETSRYLIYEFTLEKQGYFRVYDKSTNETSGLKLKVKLTPVSEGARWLTDDISGGVNIEPKFCIDGIFYSWVDALTLKKYVASDAFKTSVVKFPEKKKALQKLADSLDETDNPVLIVVTPGK